MPVRFVIDSLDFVRSARVHHGKISLNEFSRLQSYLFDSFGELVFTVTGLLNENQEPILQVTIQGEINLCCQRCLDKLVHILDLKSNLLLVSDEKELDRYDDDDTVDCILATSEMDVLMLIEEEIILSLSISSRHQDNECSIKNNIMIDQESSVHPFAKLAKLKKTH